MDVASLKARLGRALGRDPHREAATSLYAAAVEQARRPAFYQAHGSYEAPDVPDTVDGRYDLLGLHVFLLLRRLRAGPGDTKALSQALFDVMARDLEDNLRELGVGDLKVGKKVRELAERFYGRAGAYEAALGEGAPAGALAEAVGRNVLDDEAALGAATLARYVRAAEARLAEQPIEALRGGTVRFPAPDPSARGEETSHAAV